MSVALVDDVLAALAGFSGRTRLYALQLGDDEDSSGLMVEAFAADDGVQAIGTRDVIVLATDAALDLASLLGQSAVLETSLVDGTRARFTGLVSEAAMLGSFGGLARYRLRLQPWLWRLGQVRNSRVWQDKTVMEIVDIVFQEHAPHAEWRWSDETAAFMADAGRAVIAASTANPTSISSRGC